MDKIKRKTTEELASRMAAADARRQRNLKKFGKQVQIAKVQEKQRAKRETLDKISQFKKSEYLRHSHRSKNSLDLPIHRAKGG